MKVFRTILLIICLAGILAGCAAKGRFGVKGDKTYAVKNFAVSDQLKAHPPLTIAILPFENLSGDKDASGIVRRAFYNQFSSKTYHDRELSIIDATLGSKGILTRKAYVSFGADELGHLLHADALIYGKVTTFKRLMLGIYSEVAIGASLRMVDCSTDKVLWKATHLVKHRGGGVPTSPLSLIPSVISASFNMREIELLRVANDLSRDFVATIPSPPLSEAMKLPHIKILLHDSGKHLLRAGDAIHLAMIGDPGNRATFDIAGLKNGIPMEEGPNGTYQGTYKVLPGDNVHEALIKGHLTNERGGDSQWIDPLRTITIDTLAPPAPGEIKTQGRDSFVVVTWTAVKQPDLTGYRLYRSETPLSGFKVIDNIQLTRYVDKHLKNFQPHYYKVSAVDKAGNESPASSCVRGIPVSPGPTSVSGPIGVDTIWYMGASPYVISGTVTVMNEATLTIEPGTEIQSNGPGIVIRGRFMAKGAPDNYIRFLAAQSAPQGRWQGIGFDNTNDAESTVAYCKIKDAEVGVEAVTSSPEISHNIIVNNGSGVVLKEFSKSSIHHNMIKENQQDGIACLNSDIIVQYNSVVGNGGVGVFCVSSTPLVTENNIYGNKVCNLKVEGGGGGIVNAINNWWGTKAFEKIASGISGPVSFSKILDNRYAKGKSIALLRPVPPAEKTPAPAPKQPITRDADNPASHFKIGLNYYQKGKMGKAIEEMKKAIKLDPKNSAYHHSLGLVLSEAGQMKEAVSEWKKVLELEPQNENAKMLVNMYGR